MGEVGTEVGNFFLPHPSLPIFGLSTPLAPLLPESITSAASVVCLALAFCESPFLCVPQHALPICCPHVSLVLCLETLCYLDAFQVQLQCHCLSLWYLHFSYMFKVLIHCVWLQNTCVFLWLHYFSMPMFGSRQDNIIYIFISAL